MILDLYCPRHAQLTGALCAALLLAGCGSGGPTDGGATPPVTTANRIPAPEIDKISALPGTSTAIRVLDNDRDADGDTLTISAFSSPSGVSLVLNDAGTPSSPQDDFFVITPPADFAGSLQFDYTVDDGRGGSAVTTVTIDVIRRSGSAGNGAPVALADSAAMAAAAPAAIDALSNDFDPDGDALAFVSWSAPSNGVVTRDDAGTPAISSDDTLLYTPIAAFAGHDSFTYIITDGVDSATAAVKINVGAPAGEQIVSGRVPMAGAAIAVYALDDGGEKSGDALLQTVSDGAGEWSSLLPPRNAALLVTASGGYFLDDTVGLDNAARARGPHLDAAAVFETILLPDNDYAALTVLSNALVLHARHSAQGSDFAAALVSSRAAFNGAFGLDPLNVPLRRPLLPVTSGDQAARYIMLLGGVANDLNAVASQLLQSVPSATMLQAQIRDLSDCRRDGLDLDGVVLMRLAGVDVPLPVAAGIQLQSLRFRNNYAAQFGTVAPVVINESACPRPDLSAPVFAVAPAQFSFAAVNALGVPSGAAAVATALASITATDNGAPIAVSHNAPAVFALGTTTLTFSATDAAGNSTSISVDFVVSDQTPPVLSVPADVSIPLTGALTPVAIGAAVVSDNVSATGAILLSNDAPAAGFAPGVTVVTWTAIDEAGLVTTATQLVSVVGSGSPLLLSPLGDVALVQGVAVTIDISGAFEDPDGDPLSFSLLGMVANSGLTIDAASGVISGTPTNAAALAGAQMVTVTAGDGVLSAGDTFIITIANVNDSPALIAPLADVSITEDAAVSLVTAASFNDIDGDALMFSASPLPAGLGIDAASGLISGAAGNAAVSGGPYDVVVTASDGVATASDVFRLTVVNANDAPQVSASVGPRSARQDTPFSLDVSVVFFDVDGDPLTLTASGLPASLSLDVDQVIRGTPTNADAQTGSFGITLSADDGQGGMASDAFVLVVSNVADAPTVVAPIGAQNALEAAPFSLAVAGSFDDIDGDTLMFSASGLPASLTISPAGTISGTPTNADVAASPFSVTVTATDPGGLAATDSFALSIVDVNDPPQISAIADPVPLDEDTVLGPLAFVISDTDTAAASLSVTVSASNPALLPPAGLVLGGTDGNRSITITPAANASGSAVVTIQVGDGVLTTTESFTLVVNAVNDAPAFSAIANPPAVDEDNVIGPIAFTVSDAEDDANDLTVSASSDNLTLFPDGSLVVNGSGASRSLTATPASDASGSATITLTLTDQDGRLSTTTILATVNPVNDAPVITSASALSVNEDATLTVALADLVVSDPDNAYPADFTLRLTGGADYTFVGLDVSSVADFTGSLSVPVIVNDGVADSVPLAVTVTVSPINDPPVFALSGNLFLNEDFAGTEVVTVSDVPPPADESAQTVVYSLSPASVAWANVSIEPTTGDVSVTAVAEASGSATFTVTADDGQPANNLSSATFFLDIDAVNDAPAFTLSGDLGLNEDFTGTEVVTVSAAPPPADESAQTVVYSMSPASVAWANISIEPTTGDVSVTAVAEASGSATFTVTANDGQPTNNTFGATFQLDVSAVNDSPVAVNDDFVNEPDVFGDHTVLDNDSDPEGDPLTLLSVDPTSAAGGTLAINDAGTPGDPADDFIRYTPAASYTGADSYGYTISDGVDTSNATVTVDVQPLGYLSSIDPAENATGVSVFSNVVLVFGQPMNAATMTDANLFIATNPSGSAVFASSVSYSAGTMTATLTPTVEFVGNTMYYVFIKNTIENAAGVKQGFTVKSPFTTGADPTDSDGDGLTDDQEALFVSNSTHPCLADNNPDSDGDGISDGAEVSAGMNPCVNDPGQAKIYVDAAGAAGGWGTATTMLPNPPGSGTAASPTVVLIASGTYSDAFNYSSGCDNVVVIGSLDPADPGQMPQLGPNGEPTTVVDMGGALNSELADCTNFEIRNVHLRDGVGASGGGGTRGGGVRVSGTTTAVFDGVWMTDSTVGDQGGGLGVSNFTTATVRNSVIENNRVTAGKGGGGIWVGNNATLIVEDSLIRNNRADGDGGGGLYFDPGATGSVTRTVISANRASTSYGGGIYVLGASADVTVTDTVVSGNISDTYGGGIYVEFAPVTLSNLLVTGNFAKNTGGGLSFFNTPGAVARNMTVAYNQSGGAGAGLSGTGPNATVSDSIFFNNRQSARTLASAAIALDTYDDASTVISDFNLVEVDTDGGSDIDLTGLVRTPDFVAGYYLDQALSLAVESGSRAATGSVVDGAATNSDGSADLGVVDRGFHYADAWVGVADSVVVMAPVAGLSAFDVSRQSVVIEGLSGGTPVGTGRNVVFRLVSAPTNFTWDTVTLLEPLGVDSVIADDLGDGVYQVWMDLSSTASGTAQFEVFVDGTSLGVIAVPINP